MICLLLLKVENHFFLNSSLSLRQFFGLDETLIDAIYLCAMYHYWKPTYQISITSN